jgi:hypothetical protein
MSLKKAIENVIIIGGIGTMAYLLFKKPILKKEELCEESLNSIISKFRENTAKFKSELESKKNQKDFNDALSKYDATECGKLFPSGTKKLAYLSNPNSKELDKLCKTLNPTKSMPQGNLYNLCSQNENYESEIWKPLIDPNALVENPLLYASYDATYRSLYLPTGDLKANTCGDLDISAKKLNSDLMYMYDLLGSGLSNYKPIIATIEKAKLDTEAKFKKFNCRDKIEAERTKSLIDVQTKSDIKAEQSIITKGFTEQKSYIILGSLIILTGFYIAVKK